MSVQYNEEIYVDDEFTLSLNFTWISGGVTDPESLAMTIYAFSSQTWEPIFSEKIDFESIVKIYHHLHNISIIKDSSATRTWKFIESGHWTEVVELTVEQIDIWDFKSIFDSIVNIDHREKVVSALATFDEEKLGNLQHLVNISWLKSLIEEMRSNLSNSNEVWFRQPLLKKNNRILSQLFATPYVFIDDEFYCWWKKWSPSTWWVSTDFLYQNLVTNNIWFVEIKAPTADLMYASTYRWAEDTDNNTVFAPHKELTWWVNQLLNQKGMFLRKQDSLEESERWSFNIQCILLVWNSSTLTPWQKKSFELYRSSLYNIEIITFNELLDRLNWMLLIFDNNS